ncbi:hypothetical protein EJB05_09132, partial [Eragrostis curvula]
MAMARCTIKGLWLLSLVLLASSVIPARISGQSTADGTKRETMGASNGMVINANKPRPRQCFPSPPTDFCCWRTDECYPSLPECQSHCGALT